MAGGNGGEPGRPGAPPDPGERFVTLARCSTATVADFVRSVLDQAGIESVLQDQYLSQMFSFLSRPIGGVRVQVRLRDLPAAIEALRRPPEPLAPDAEPPGAPAASLALRCPECGSERVAFTPADPAGFLIAWIERILPLPFLHGHWTCMECGKRWLESSLPAS